jgi:hypothetical protein
MVLFCGILAGCPNTDGNTTPGPVTISNISLTGLVAPAGGAQPQTAAGLIPENESYTVQSLTWSPEPGGNFAEDTEYTAAIVLKAAAGYLFSETVSLSVNTGTSSAETVSGAGVGNTLSFTVSFPFNPSSILISFQDISDENIVLPDITLYKVSFNGTDKLKTAALSLTEPTAYSSIEWTIDTSTPQTITGGQINLDAGNYVLGNYFITVEVTKNAIPYSKTFNLSVLY